MSFRHDEHSFDCFRRLLLVSFNPFCPGFWTAVNPDWSGLLDAEAILGIEAAPPNNERAPVVARFGHSDRVMARFFYRAVFASPQSFSARNRLKYEILRAFGASQTLAGVSINDQFPAA
ncbi:MAG: hypothetical protein HY040_23805 [Planctomycetes bacterium]|nr:hypothetical protein [Planctomycetota bacterium]